MIKSQKHLREKRSVKFEKLKSPFEKCPKKLTSYHKKLMTEKVLDFWLIQIQFILNKALMYKDLQIKSTLYYLNVRFVIIVVFTVLWKQCNVM